MRVACRHPDYAHNRSGSLPDPIVVGKLAVNQLRPRRAGQIRPRRWYQPRSSKCMMLMIDRQDVDCGRCIESSSCRTSIARYVPLPLDEHPVSGPVVVRYPSSPMLMRYSHAIAIIHSIRVEPNVACERSAAVMNWNN